MFTHTLSCKHASDGRVLGQTFMFISTMGILLYAKVYPLYSVLLECIVVVYT